MRRRTAALLAAFLALWLGTRMLDARAAAQEAPNIRTNAKGAALIEAETGRVLFEQEGHLRLPMASTTKIMTALLALEQPDLEEPFIVDAKAIRVEGTSMGLREGDTATLHTLAYGMLLPSGNDAANAAAARIAGNVPAFAVQMNARAEEIGLMDTHFVTPSGLHDEAHYSSAVDMALLAREALKNPLFAEVCGKSSARVEFGNPPYSRRLQNHNRLLEMCDGAVGVKTGFTKTAGRCLVSAVKRDGITLIAVTLNCPDDWNEHIRLYEYGFSQVKPQTPEVPKVSLPVAGGLRASVPVAAQDVQEPLAALPGDNLETLVCAEPFLYAPVRRGQVVGCAFVRAGGRVLREIPLVAVRDVEASTQEEETFFERIGEWLHLGG